MSTRTDDDWQIVARAVVPAEPGWWVITLSGDELKRDTIVAWSVQVGEEECRWTWAPDQEAFVTRVATEGVAESYVIQRPDGGLYVPYYGAFENDKEVLEHLKEMKRQDNETKEWFEKHKREERR